METKTTFLATVNNVAIEVVETDQQRMIPIKPICNALSIDYSRQLQKIKEDEFLSSVIGITPTTGSDGKTYEMVCLPFEFIFGWLFTINPKNVRPEAKEAVSRYRIECFRALFDYFTEPQTYLKQKQEMIDRYLDEYEQAKKGFSQAKKIMDERKKEFDRVRNFSIEEWRANNRQYCIPFNEQ